MFETIFLMVFFLFISWIDAVNEEDEEEINNNQDQNYEKDYPSLSTSTVAVYAKSRLSVEGLPTPGSTDSTYACVLR